MQLFTDSFFFLPFPPYRVNFITLQRTGIAFNK